MGHPTLNKFTHLGLAVTGAMLSAVIAVAAIAGASAPAAWAASLQDSTAITAFTTGNAAADQLTITTNGQLVTLSLKSKQAIPWLKLRLYDKSDSGAVADGDNVAAVAKGGTYSSTVDLSNVPDGEYRLRLFANDPYTSELVKTQYPYLDGMKVTKASGAVKLQTFSTVAAHNASVKNSRAAKTYATTDMSDLFFQVFRQTDKGKTTSRYVKSTEANYYKTRVKSILSALPANATAEQKLVAIYEFVANNFYYDDYGKANGKAGFDDPYYNLKHQASTTGSGYNYSAGKVAMQCDGYAAVFVALSRAAGIPARMVYGHKHDKNASRPFFWDGASASTFKQDHTWVQAYVGGKWINIDPQQASLNKRGVGKSNPSNNTFTKAYRINYLYFDMSSAFMANLYYAKSIPGDDLTKFKYYLKKGNKSTMAPWNLSAQKRLKQLKYFKSTPNGKFVSSTTKAVKAFQKKNKLRVTGQIDKRTWKKLFSSKAKKK